MKKLIFSLLLALTTLSALATEPILRFACMSDIHNQQSMINPSNPADVRLRTSFLTTLETLKSHMPDLIVLGGDYTSDVTVPEANWQQVRQLMYNATTAAVKANAAGKHPVLYCTGNHDYEVANFDNIPKSYNAADYMPSMVQDLGALPESEKFYEDAPNGTSTMHLLAAYHYVINGIDFVVLNCGKNFFKSAWDYQYSPESVAWVDAKLTEIYASDPDKTVFFIAHLPLPGSTGVTTGKTMSATAASTAALKTALLKHPNLIFIYGHDHSTNKSFYQKSITERISIYKNDGTATQPEDQIPAVLTDVNLYNASTGKYLGMDSYNITLKTTPHKYTVDHSSAVTNTLTFFAENPPTNGNGYIYCGSGGRFSGNQAVSNKSSILLYEVNNVNGTLKGTRVAWPEAGKDYALVCLSSGGGYYLLKAEVYSPGSTSQRMIGVTSATTDEITIPDASEVWRITEHVAAVTPSQPAAEEHNDFYIQDQAGNYLDYDGNIKTVGSNVSATQGFRITPTTATTSPYAGTAVNMLCLSSSDSRYIHIGSGGKFSGNTAIGNTNVGTSLWLYEVNGTTATRTTTPVSGNKYLIVGNKSGTYYQMLNTNNGLAGNDLRELSEALSITSPVASFTYNGNTAALWTLTVVPADQPAADDEDNFMSIFMGSMRYNSFDTNSSPGVNDSPVIQSLMVSVYEDKVVFEMLNYGQTGSVSGSNISANITDPLDAYTLTREVKGSPTAITTIEAPAEGPVTYYDLQGRQVMNPQHGLFIKHQGNKATKVIL